MGRPAGQIEKVYIDEYIAVKQRRISCHACGTLYIGPKEDIVCLGCKTALKTYDAKAVKNITLGIWSLFKDKQISNSSIMGEVIADGGDSST